MDIVAVLTKVVKEQQEALKAQQGLNEAQRLNNQEQQRIITVLTEQNAAIPELSRELNALKLAVIKVGSPLLAD